MVLFKPYPYQFDAISFINSHKEGSALFADMGLGKTAIILTYLMMRKRDNPNFKTLIIAPKRVCDFVWPQEIEQWDHTKLMTYFRLNSKKDLNSGKLNSDILIINTENIFPYIAALSKLCNCLIVDESTGFKNHNSKRFKALKPLLKRFESRIILSGTPMPKCYLDLFSQYYIVDLGESLTEFITIYRKTFFDMELGGWGPTKYPKYILKPGATDVINEIIGRKTLRIDKENNLDMPELVYDNIIIGLTPKLQSVYDKLEKEMIIELQDKQLIIDNASIKYIRCHQFANGVVYDDNKQDEFIHNLKIQALEELIESLQGKPLFITYWYKSDLRALQKKFTSMESLGLSDKKDPSIIKRWNAGKIALLSGHPGSVGHGLNLQFSSNHIAWFSLSSHYEKYEQFNGRLARLGQKEKSVFIHKIIVRNTVDERFISREKYKHDNMQALFEYLERKHNAKIY